MTYALVLLTLLLGLAAFISRMLWRLGEDESAKSAEWTGDDQAAYEVLCDWERES